MKAQVLHAHGGIADITWQEDWEAPAPGPGQVEIAVRACALNYHDLFTLRGMPGIKVPMPIIMGIDAAGVVARIGEGVEGWAGGDRVVIDPIDRKTGKLFGEMQNGGLAERAIVGAHQLVSLPDDVSFEAAAALPCAYGTAYRMMLARGKVSAGEKVLILGASGGVGAAALLIAKRAGKDYATLLDDWIDAALAAAVSTSTLTSADKEFTAEPSLYDQLLERGMLGCFEGPTDLATNPKHMEGFGQHGRENSR